MSDEATISFLTDDDQIVVFRPPDEQTLADNFARFHAENPHVYELLAKLARRWLRHQTGRRCGIGMLYETARWYLDARGNEKPVALNNNYRAFYARLLMEREPDLADIFETRRQRHDQELAA